MWSLHFTPVSVRIGSDHSSDNKYFAIASVSLAESFDVAPCVSLITRMLFAARARRLKGASGGGVSTCRVNGAEKV